MNFTFSLPVWGAWHTSIYLEYGLSSHCAAGLEGTYVVHTDNIDALVPHLENARKHRGLNCRIEYVEVNPNASYFQFSEYQQQVFNLSEACVFLSPDAMIARTTFAALQVAVAGGAKFIECPGVNTTGWDTEPPSDNLQAWARDHLIAELRGNIWTGGGDMMCPLTMYFRDGDNFWTHATYHHPLCAVNDGRHAPLVGTTIDWLLPQIYSQAETVMLHGTEALMVEMSPAHKFMRHERYQIHNSSDIAVAIRDKALTCHRALYRKPLAIVGEPTSYEGSLIDDALGQLRFMPYAGTDVNIDTFTRNP